VSLIGSELLHPVLPGWICADHGCDLVHPSATHDAYTARFDHARTCQACRRADAVWVMTDESRPNPLATGFATELHHPGDYGRELSGRRARLNRSLAIQPYSLDDP
jgi:hypothetical protein